MNLKIISPKTSIGLCFALAVSLFIMPRDAKSQTPQVKIAFVGDSMIDGIWGGFMRLAAMNSCLKPILKLGRYGENGAGLARADRYDWKSTLQKINQEFQPDITLLSFGLNDRQDIVDRTKTRIEFGNEKYPDAYRMLVREFIDAAERPNTVIAWIGLPTLRDKSADDDAKQKNEIFKRTINEINNPNLFYVQPWRLSPSQESEQFKMNGPGLGGTITILRAPDGIHFTSSGYDVVVSYLLSKVTEIARPEQQALLKSCTGK